MLLVTERKPISFGNNLPMVVFFPTKRFLDVMDSIPNVSAMLVVPWIMKEVKDWITTWNATELGAPKQARAAPLVRNKVVEVALRDLTALVNVSTGISHPMDRERAVQALIILRDGGELFTPEEIKAWLIAEGGWAATDAQEVAEIAQKVLERRPLKKGSQAWRKTILKSWREEAVP